jgi:hypothetical protein
MNTVKRNDDLFTEDSEDSRPLRLVFDNPETDFENSKTDNISLFSDEVVDPTLENELFPDKLFPDELDDMFNCKVDPKQPIIRLLPDNPSEEAVLRLRVQLLEVKLARQNAQLDFAERIDVDHLEWKRQKNRIRSLQVGNFLLTAALMVGAGCLVVIR